MLDEHLWGATRRISPEAPVPVVEVRDRTYAAGGAGNVAAGIVALGGIVSLAGLVGEDPGGGRLRAALSQVKIDPGGLVSTGNSKTITKTRVIAQGQQVVRIDDERPESIGPEVEHRLLDWLNEALVTADAVVLSDYAKGLITPEVARQVIDLAQQRSVPVIVDPKAEDFTKYRGATVLTPNLRDAKRAVGAPAESFVEFDDLVGRLAPTVPGSALLITCGAEGMKLWTEGRRIDVFADAQEVYDVTGAGDTAVATLAICLGSSIGLPTAVRAANAAAGIAVRKVGTAVVSREELIARLPELA